MRRRCFCPAEHCCCSQFGSSGRAGPCSLCAPRVCLANPTISPKPRGSPAIGCTLGPLKLCHQPLTRLSCPTEPRACPSLMKPPIPWHWGESAVWHLGQWKGSGGPRVLFAATQSATAPVPSLCPCADPPLSIFSLSCFPCQ